MGYHVNFFTRGLGRIEPRDLRLNTALPVNPISDAAVAVRPAFAYQLSVRPAIMLECASPASIEIRQISYRGSCTRTLLRATSAMQSICSQALASNNPKDRR